MYKIYLFFLVILYSQTSFSQTLLNIIEYQQNDFKTHSPINTIIETYTGNNEKTIYSFNKNQQLVSRRPFESEKPVSFSIYWNYDESINYPIGRMNVKKSKYFILKEYYKYKYDLKGLIEIIQYDDDKNITYKSIIENDSLGNPVHLKLLNGAGSFIGEEKAQYYYQDNIVEILIYDSESRLVRGILNPIYPQKKSTSLDEFVKKLDFNKLKSESKNWQNLRIMYISYEYKFHKKGYWIKKTKIHKNYVPSTLGASGIVRNPTLVRKYKFY